MAELITENGTPYIEDKWDLFDFRQVASGYEEEEFTDEELLEAMESVVHNYDANYGITWDAIQAALDRVLWNRKYSKKKTYTVWETCTATNRYTVQAENDQEARQLVADAQVEARETDYSNYEITFITEIPEETDDNNQ